MVVRDSEEAVRGPDKLNSAGHAERRVRGRVGRVVVWVSSTEETRATNQGRWKNELLSEGEASAERQAREHEKRRAGISFFGKSKRKAR